MATEPKLDSEMQHLKMAGWRRIVGTIGSLWFGAVLLMLLVVSMGFATIFESMRGTQQALALFYKSGWFTILLAIAGINLLASMIARLPFRKRNLGFMLTHVGIVVTLIGAAVTHKWGIDGRIGMFEGDVTDTYVDSYTESLTLTPMTADSESTTLDLPTWLSRSFQPASDIDMQPLVAGKTNIAVSQFLPDAVFVSGVENNAQDVHHAVEVALDAHGQNHPTWLMQGDTLTLHGRRAVLHVVDKEDAFNQLLVDDSVGRPGEHDVVRITINNKTMEVPVRTSRDAPVPVGQTGMSIHVLRYFWSASVERGGGIINASKEPKNPMIEVELTGPAGTDTRRCFAKFPDFGMGHGQDTEEEVKVVYVAPSPAPGTAAPIEVFLHPGSGRLAVRFSADGVDPVTTPIKLGVPVETPWQNHTFRVTRHYDHARPMEDRYAAVDPPGKEARRVVELTWTDKSGNRSAWLPKYTRKMITVDGASYGISYTDKIVPLGFKITLNDFEVGHYPGTMSPRTFESSVTMVEPQTGLTIKRVISMNNPASFGGFELFQSAWNQDETGRKISYLSISRDPGTSIVYAGYIITTLGMILGLVTIGSRARHAHRHPDMTTSTKLATE